MGAAKNTRTGRDFLLRSLADGAARFNTGDCDAFYPGADILGGEESTGRGASEGSSLVGARRGPGPLTRARSARQSRWRRPVPLAGLRAPKTSFSATC